MPLAIELAAARLRTLPPPCSPTGWPTGSGCSPAAAAPRCPGTGRCARWSSGAGTCSTEPSGRLAEQWRCSPPVRPRRSPRSHRGGAGLRPRPATCSARWSTSRCWSRPGPATARYRMLETIREYGVERLAEPGRVRRGAHRARPLVLRPGRRRGRRGCAGPSRSRGCGGSTPSATTCTRRCAAAATPATPRTPSRLVARLGWYWWLRGHRPGRRLAGRPGAAPCPGRDEVPGRRARRGAAAVLGFAGGTPSPDPGEAREQVVEMAQRLDAGRPATRPLRVLRPLLLLIGDEPAAAAAAPRWPRPTPTRGCGRSRGWPRSRTPEQRRRRPHARRRRPRGARVGGARASAGAWPRC